VYRHLIDHRVAMRTYGRLDWAMTEYRQFVSVLMPFADVENRIARIIGAAVYGSLDSPVVRTWDPS
jgi:hypothetical protein